ncbi:hypothetical protein [Vibrio parahaemolyticus]|uniref:hypothetical protein n=1 Tax=Vibrio parahaemolyticus TaxID=670 RepID=UPI0023609D7C|nr:hypothetical protein [Vibrio parahaemolyticus]
MPNNENTKQTSSGTSRLRKMISEGVNSTGETITAVYLVTDEYFFYSINESNLSSKVSFETDASKDREKAFNENFKQLTDARLQLSSVVTQCGDNMHGTAVSRAYQKAFEGNVVGANKDLKNITETIKKEHDNRRRCVEAYTNGSMILSFFACLYALILFLYRAEQDVLGIVHPPQIVYELVVFIGFTSLGAVLSIVRNSDRIPVPKWADSGTCFSAGAKRVVIAMIGGVAIYFAIRSGFIFNLKESGLSMKAVIAIGSGYSEHLVTETLNNINQKLNSKMPPEKK